MSGSRFAFLLRPKWIGFHVLVFGSIVLMIWLGFWQLDRLDSRRAFNDVVEARIVEPPVRLDDLLATGIDDVDEFEWRQVTVSGRWLDAQVLWFNRSQDGVAGDNVLTGLTFTGAAGADTTVIVNRGFIPLGVDTPPPPGGEVDVLARVRVPAERQLGELTDDADGPVTEVRRVDLGQLAAQVPGEVPPVYLDLIASVPEVTAADPAPVPPPAINEGPHLSYAVQWFIFAFCVFVGWVFAVRYSLRSRRRAARTADDEAHDDDDAGDDHAGTAAATAATTVSRD
jgi:surfeit locus 1 family protein